MYRKLFWLCSLVLYLPQYASGQVDSIQELNEIVISGLQESKTKETSLHIEAFSLKKIETHIPFNLSDALAHLPGVSQMTTGNSISKPVIRGLYGNRILVLFSGLRFDNQQFQDEHGLGLSQIGIDRIELIRGPVSSIYGTDAVGGVINIIEEKGGDKPGSSLDIGTRLYSNTMGTLTDIGYKKLNKKGSWWRVRGGFENHADYASGGNVRVLNSRNKGYYFKTGMGFTKKAWTMENAYNFSYNQYGFIINDLTTFFSADARGSRSMAGPHHNVLLNILSTQNTFRLRSSILKVNAGVQSNKRAEDEGGGAISLNMHLLSVLENAKWEKELNKKLLLVINQQSTYEKNLNLGKRILIPDATMFENNLSVFARYHTKKLSIEFGIGYINKQIKTLKTGTLNIGSVNTPDVNMGPFENNRSSFNGMAGISYNPANWVNLKTNISTGTRSANLAELSSNGLHEGVYRCEIGDPKLKAEQNLNTDLTLELERKTWFLSVSGYYNKFLNYIYLSPTTENWNGFAIFRYVQKDAALYGGELMAIVKPTGHLQLKETFSITQGILKQESALDSSKYLPFIPPARSLSSIRYEHATRGKNGNYYIEPELEYSFAQNHTALFETTTPAYMLLNILMGSNRNFGNKNLDLKLAVRNLLDRSYADHLSRLKYYGLNNQGINFVVSLNVKFARS